MDIIIKSCLHYTLVIFMALFSCEYLIYKINTLFCKWPVIQGDDFDNKENLKVFFLADPHLLGPVRGHWFDKLRREWQMKMSFQSAYKWLDPNYVIVLGDLFDEGELVDEKDWKDYLQRFHNDIFHMKKKERLKVIVGNHDVGFHHTILYDESKWRRFQRTYGVQSSVELFNLRNISYCQKNKSLSLHSLTISNSENQFSVKMLFQHYRSLKVIKEESSKSCVFTNRFLAINSMALKQDDGCNFCEEATHHVNKISKKVVKDSKRCQCEMLDGVINCSVDRQTIILQHFPLYRENELPCVQFVDGPSQEAAQKQNRESWDVLSKESTDFLLEKVQPCLVMSGHTHHGCFLNHHNIYEISVPSLSWRNINNPSITLVSFQGDNIYISKCYLPKETTVFGLYLISIIYIVCSVLRTLIKRWCKRRKAPAKSL